MKQLVEICLVRWLMMDEDLKRGIYGIIGGLILVWLTMFVAGSGSVPAGVGLFFFAGIIIFFVGIAKVIIGIVHTIKNEWCDFMGKLS